MSKYFFSFKFEVVQYYFFGMEGQKAIVKRFGIDYSVVRKWIVVWKFYGEVGFIIRYFVYFFVFKEFVILYMREYRLFVREVCVKFIISVFFTVFLWERLYDEGGLEVFIDSRRGRKTMLERFENNSVFFLQVFFNYDEREEFE